MKWINCATALFVLCFSLESSIEDAKQKAEHDKMLKLAEEKKLKVKQTIAMMRDKFRKLLEKNNEIPEHLRLARSVRTTVYNIASGIITVFVAKMIAHLHKDNLVSIHFYNTWNGFVVKNRSLRLIQKLEKTLWSNWTKKWTLWRRKWLGKKNAVDCFWIKFGTGWHKFITCLLHIRASFR